MGLLSTLAAHDLGFIQTGELVERLDATLTTMEGLERHEGHLFNWYDTVSLAPLPAPLRLHGRQRQPGRRAHRARRGAPAARARAGCPGRPGRAGGDPGADPGAGAARGVLRRRHELPVPLRSAARACSPSATGRRTPRGRAGSIPPTTTCWPRRRASPASSASPRATCPRSTGSTWAGPSTSVHGIPTLLSWSATLFEYLMPLLVMRSYPDTLLDETCRMAVRRQRDYGAERGVAWGISESGYGLVDHLGNYQYKAFGVPGLGLKRGLADELVVAPYATALAALVHPTAAAANLRRLAREGLLGEYGFYEAIDYTPRHPEEAGADAPWPAHAGGEIVREHLAHHQGMTLSALASALTGHRMVEPLPRRPARAGDGAAAPGARAAPGRAHAAAPRRGRARRRAAAAGRGAPLPLAADARRRTRSSSPTATTPPWSPTPAGARASAAGVRSPAGARTRPATRGASTSTCATCGADGCGRPPISRRARRRRARSSPSPWRRRPSSGGTTRSGPGSTWRSRRRTTSRCGGWR